PGVQHPEDVRASEQWPESLQSAQRERVEEEDRAAGGDLEQAQTRPLPIGFELGVEEERPIRLRSRIQLGFQPESRFAEGRLILDQAKGGAGRALGSTLAHRMPCGR